MQMSYNGLHVRVDLEKGVYVFFPDSGSGKSYLASIFRELSASTKRVSSYTYTDSVRNMPIDLALDSARYDLVVLDRYDMYYGVGVESIIQFGKSGTVLVDCKQPPPFPHKTCAVSYYRDVLEVTEL